MKMPRLLIADDHPLILEGLRKSLETSVEIVGTVSDGRALISSALLLKPDIVLLDISMPLLDGMEAARKLKGELPRTKLIFLSVYSDPEFVAEARRLGASGFVVKQAAITDLTDAIRQVVKGRTYYSSFLRKPPTAFGFHAPEERLTARQSEVLQLLAEGRGLKEISSLLRISVRTVEFHKYGIMERLDLHSLAELTKYAIRHGITEQ